MRTIFASVLLLGITTTAFGGFVNSPEIDGTTAAGALTLISGAVLVLRSRRKR